MRRGLLLALVAGLMTIGCGGDEGGEEDFSIDFPHTVTLGPEQGLVAPTGEILGHADFKNGDLVTYKNQTIKIQTGCEVSQAHCRPLHVCRQSAQSKPDTFTSLDETCMIDAAEGDPSIIANAETGMGFTIQLNTADGYGRFWVKDGPRPHLPPSWRFPATAPR